MSLTCLILWMITSLSSSRVYSSSVSFLKVLKQTNLLENGGIFDKRSLVKLYSLLVPNVVDVLDEGDVKFAHLSVLVEKVLCTGRQPSQVTFKHMEMT